MSAVSDYVAAVDAFIALDDKRLAGAEGSPVWQPGWTPDERKLKLPIEVYGEQRGEFLLLLAYPQHPTLKFAIALMVHDIVVCRLDYDQETTHANNFGANLPYLIHGPHWHSWELNRDSLKSLNEYWELHNAVPFSAARQYDSVLRWYCARRNITIGTHGLGLPPRERLI